MKPVLKQKIKMIFRIAVWCALIIVLFVSLAFVNREEAKVPCKSLDISVTQEDDNYFIQQEDIKQIIKDRGDSVINQPVSTINIPELEKVLNSNASIAKAEVYVSVDGKMKIEIIQRKPIVRIINQNNESYYLDDLGKLMPLSDKYTARVLVANGNIFEPYARRYMYSVADIESNPDVKDKTLLDDLFNLSQYINAEPFWKAQISQIYINNESEIELIPRVGDHKIILGDITDMDEKFKKLMTFYKEGLNTTGWWNNYSVINLKFKNQIVCTKKV